MSVAPVTVGIGRRRFSAFRSCGTAGLLAAIAVALAAAAGRGLSLWIEGAIIAGAVLTFLGLATATTRITGREALIYYHHEIAVLTVTGLLAYVAGAPVLGHLDATALGLGAFLACGRVGCLVVGCCHGRPAGQGIRYGARHVRAGFPSYLAGTPLVPVQAVEAVSVAILVAVGAALPPRPAGAAFGAYLSGFAVLRFGLEELRGDTLRRWWHGLSEAQWTSLVIAVGTAVAAVAGVLPSAAPHVAAALGLIVAAPVVTYRRRRDILAPAHIRELMSRCPAASTQSTVVAETSLGLRMSSGVTGGAAHYTLSLAGGRVLSPEAAAALAGALVSSRHRGVAAQLVHGAAGAYHLVVRHPGAIAPSTSGAAPVPA